MIRSKLRRVLATGAIVVGALLIPAGAALAQDDTYPTPTNPPTVSSVGGSSTQLDQPTDSGGELPVTGGQLAGLTIAGLGITGAGVALVVLARRPQRARAQA